MTLKNGMRRCWEHSLCAAFLLAFCGVMTAAQVIPVQAAPKENTEIVHNEQQLDLFTGEQAVPAEEKQEIRFSQYCTYEKDEARYVYTYDEAGEKTVYASVADGMYTNETVTVSWSEAMTCKVYCNGREVDYRSGGVLEEPGFYQTLISDSTGTEEYSLAFCIINKYTSAANYKVPEGFEIEEVTYEGNPVVVTDQLISMKEEGTYHVVLRSAEGAVTSAVDMTVDHTAPTLLLKEVDEKGFAHGPVDVSDVEPGAVIYASLDGNECRVGKRLTQPGLYRLSVQDEAGNTTEYTFLIRMYFTVSTVVVILLLIAVLAALAAYIAISRRRITVR